jgi:hypothetical protein
MSETHTKRLQVLFEPSEFEALQGSAAAAGLSLSEWVRTSLRTVRRQQSSGDVERKLELLRTAGQYDFPVSDIEQVNREIAVGRGQLPQ